MNGKIKYLGRECFLSVLLMQDHLESYFSGFHLAIFSHPGTQRLLQLWPKEAWLLLELMVEHDVGCMMLVLQACRMQEFGLSFHRKAWEVKQCSQALRGQCVKLWVEGQAAVENSGN